MAVSVRKNKTPSCVQKLLSKYTPGTIHEEYSELHSVCCRNAQNEPKRCFPEFHVDELTGAVPSGNKGTGNGWAWPHLLMITKWGVGSGLLYSVMFLIGHATHDEEQSSKYLWAHPTSYPPEQSPLGLSSLIIPSPCPVLRMTQQTVLLMLKRVALRKTIYDFFKTHH